VLAEQDLAAPTTASGGSGATELWATDDGDRFARVGAGFLGVRLHPGQVQLVDL
jgi:hypothetical protein